MGGGGGGGVGASSNEGAMSMGFFQTVAFCKKEYYIFSSILTSCCRSNMSEVQQLELKGEEPGILFWPFGPVQKIKTNEKLYCSYFGVKLAEIGAYENTQSAFLSAV
jgi:hypothetical protein